MPAFFCVHGAGGNVLQFYDLARNLGPEYPFYGLQAQGLDGSQKHLTSIQEMGLHYLKEIRELQPEGPYYLGGFCMRGHVAYEMAQCLLREGQRVALLVMFDTYNFNGVPLHLSFCEGIVHVKQKIAFNWENLLRLSLKEQLVFLRKKLKHVSNREVASLFAKLSSILKLNPFGDGLKPSDILLERINTKAHFDYAPSVYPEKMTIVKPQQHFAHLRDPQMGWDGMAAGGLEMIELPVDPGGMFFEPYVRVLAENLKTLIDDARQ
jgi:thioesterase domain-containing protein